METIYLDRLFILNLIIDYLLLLGSARVCGVKLRRRRYFFSALTGAVYAVCSVLPHLDFLRTAFFKLCTGLLMALIAFGKEEKLLRCILIFLSVSVFFGGAVWAISMRGEGMGKSAVYLPVSMPVLALSFGICYAVLSLVFRRTGRSMGRKTHEISISLRGKSLSLTALEDSGNSLYDPISGSAVIIASKSALTPLFEDCAEILMNAEPTELVSGLSDKASLRLIPYTAVGTDSGLLAAFRADELYVDGKKRDDLLIAISPTEIAGEGFDCIM